MSELLPASDLRALFELHGELTEVAERAPDRAIDHLMLSVPALLGGDPAMWWTVTNAAGTALLATRIAGLDAAARRVWEQAYLLEGAFGENPVWPHVLSPSPMRTLRRRDVVSDREWYGSPHIAEYCRGLGYDDCIVSRRVVGDHAVGARPMQGMLAVCRPWGGRPFSDRDSAIVHLLQKSLGWLHRRATRTAPARRREEIRDALPPRFRRVLDHVLRGCSEKEIAHALVLSQRTVHKYIEAIYEAYAVTSRAELMAQWIDP